MLQEHRALTAAQITELAFTTLRRANNRLADLAALHIADRSRPNPATHPGTSPYIYTLGPAGALLVAAERDQTVKELRYDRAALLRQAARPDLAHTLGCNTTVIQLATRPGSGTSLAAWWGPVSCMRLWGDLIRPDAFLVTTHRHSPSSDSVTCAGWFFEYDTGTESIHQLATKLRGYHRHSQNFTGSHPVLIHLPTLAREARLHQVISEMYPDTCPVPLATTTGDLAAASWRTAPGQTRQNAARYHLAGLRAGFSDHGFRLLSPTINDAEVHAPTPVWNSAVRTRTLSGEITPCSPNSAF